MFPARSTVALFDPVPRCDWPWRLCLPCMVIDTDGRGSVLSANQIGGWLRPRTLPPASELAAMYDEAASRWHRSLQRLGYPRAYADLFARLHALGRLGSLTDGDRVLDCGIGAGDLSLALARATVAPVQIEGVDISARMRGRGVSSRWMGRHWHVAGKARQTQPGSVWRAIARLYRSSRLALNAASSVSWTSHASILWRRSSTTCCRSG